MLSSQPIDMRVDGLTAGPVRENERQENQDRGRAANEAEEVSRFALREHSLLGFVRLAATSVDMSQNERGSLAEVAR
jgi:hypothetical protein